MRKTLNIGCGEKTFKRYPDREYKCINVDSRSLKGVNQVAEADNLHMFKDNYFHYILASDIIEHFPAREVHKVLKEWSRVLKRNGIVEFRLPNLRVIAKAYIEGVIEAKQASWLLYGGQDYSGNFHYAAYDLKSFSTLLGQNMFTVVKYKEVDFNMVVLAQNKKEK